ncbi:putative intracellular protease/amidase [Melghirimyces profundicolus]|uniref:Putative intracellular protease/amidase n=1 Tax=Melghirimyces profundicolus TaxID=1242148 RepID=A0A2T6B0P3_9BACL|nr:type 1 glutamine amidotransferase domain-containing protein [Melghirimyces profundicolus]PTX49620.1 putative intracellular protease/amidase [Melghirimyces profundicolus]
MAKKVLFIMTNHDQVDPEHPTGVWLEEFAVPYEEFKAKGYEIKVTSPKGGEVPIDPHSETDETRGKWKDAREAMQDTAKLSEEDGEGFDAVFLPGGHGTMFDFPNDPVVQKVLNRFAEERRVIGSVCHGPSGLVNVHLDNGTPLVAGRKVTAFTNEEEDDTGLKEQMPFLLESKLREQGAKFMKGDKWADFTVRDEYLITGQNPQSSRSAAKKVIEALEE